MSEASQTDDQQSLRMQLRDVEDFAKSFLRSRLEALREDHDELEARVDDLEDEVERLRAWRENVTGVADDQESTPDKRALDLREAMIRQARQTSADGATWWWQQVQENLISLGHGGFKKPTYYAAMEDAAEADGFDITTKTVTIPQGDRTVTKDVKAVRVKLEKLPANGAQSGRKQVTTRGAGGDGSESAERGANMTD